MKTRKYAALAGACGLLLLGAAQAPLPGPASSAQGTNSMTDHEPARPVLAIATGSNRVEVTVEKSVGEIEFGLQTCTDLLRGDWQPLAPIARSSGAAFWSGPATQPRAFFRMGPIKQDKSAASKTARVRATAQVRASTTPAAPAAPEAKRVPAPAAVKANVVVSLQAYEAWRRGSAPVPESAEFRPGVLITQNIDGGSNDPREAQLVFKALPAGKGLTRHIRFSSRKKLEFRDPRERRSAWIPSATEVRIPGRVDVDFIRDVAMYRPQDWKANTSVTVSYVVKDSSGRTVGVDRVRFLRPVVMVLGDSLTFGFMRRNDGVRMTPPTKTYTGWAARKNWSAYPNDAQWRALPPPWNVPAHKRETRYQGYRGYLRSRLPGFAWKGENPLGHGPAHMGYNGATIDEIANRAPAGLLGTGPCYAIIVYCAGANDVGDGYSVSHLYRHWQAGVEKILTARANKGKTLLIGAAVPQIETNYQYFSLERQNNIRGLNSAMRGYAPAAPHVRYQFADIENVPHRGGDDGLHYFHRGYESMARIIYAGIQDGLR